MGSSHDSYSIEEDSNGRKRYVCVCGRHGGWNRDFGNFRRITADASLKWDWKVHASLMRRGTTDRRVLTFRLATLASNLAIAAALCAAFKQGTRWPYFLDAEDLSDDYAWSDWGRDAWRPGHAIPCAQHGTPRAEKET